MAFVPVALFLFGAAMAAGSCSFPEFSVVESATASSGTTGGGGDGAAGGSPTSSGGSGGGSGGVAGNPDPACMGGGGFGGEALCDVDDDQVWKQEPPCCELPSDADCNDDNVDVFAHQDAWFDQPIPGAPAATDFDYDCDGNEERNPSQMITPSGEFDCGGLTTCKIGAHGFGPDATCGSDDNYFECALIGTSVCQAQPIASKKGLLQCH